MRIDPVADIDAGERRTQRLRDLARGDAERAGERAIELTSSSGFCPCVDRPTSTAPGTFLTSAEHPSAICCSSRRVRSESWIWICF